MDNEILKKTIDKNGIFTQSVIAMEECSELAQAISKCLRSGDELSKEIKYNLVEEMADVLIIIEQLRMMYDVSDEDLNCWLEFKTKRLECRLNEK